MSSKPIQIRTIDPFAEYNSNVANRLTRMLTQNANVLLSTNSLSLTLDSTSPLSVAVVQTGIVFKDDVMIEITADHEVDFYDASNYITPAGGIFNETGYYYIVLEYTYVKSRPAPDVDIKILRPSARSAYTNASSLMLLGVVKVITVGPVQVFDLSDPFHNFDPEFPDNRREFVKFYAGSETNLPEHETFRDQSRIAYDTETDKFWLGYEDSWQEFGIGGSIIGIDTTGTAVGQLCYVDTDGSAIAAIATSLTTGADIVVKAVGLAIDSSGKGLTSGIGEDVPIETAIVVTTGDLLYLSDTEAGKATNVQTSPFYQVVGRAITSGDSSNPIDIIFTPKVVLATAAIGQIPGVVSTAGWTLSGADYYHDIDISDLGVSGILSVLSNFFDNSTQMQIVPMDVELRDTGDTLRVWMSVATVTVNYIVSTGGGGAYGAGGGGGGSDHALLLNLDYASAGHSGFAPSPHGNGDHSGAYIEAAGVTYGNLDANSDVGTGGTQVAVGNHSHDGLIASGTIMLFGQASAPTGWTQKITGFSDDAMIVISKVISGGAGQGGSADARAFDPNVVVASGGGHSHTTGSLTLTIAQMPSHNHGISASRCESGSGDAESGNGLDEVSTSTGGGGSHNHGSTSAVGNHTHSTSYDNYDPYYFTIIAATKD